MNVRSLHEVKHVFRNRNWVPVLGLGILVRIVVMPLTWHNDAVWMPWMAHLIIEGSPNVYQTLFDRFGPEVLSPVVWAPYLPLFYWFLAGWTGVLEALHLVDVGQWSFSAYDWIIPHFPRAVFLAKLPWVVADIAVWGIVLSMLNPRQRKRFSWLYLFFPSQIWVSSVMGQNDILPALMTIVALWYAGRALRTDRFIYSVSAALVLGFGGGVKLYPLLLLVPTVLILGRSLVEVGVLATAGVLPFTLTVLPLLHTPAFVEGALTNPEGTALFDAALGSGIQSAPVFIVFYSLLLIYLAFHVYPRTLRTVRLTYLAILSFLLISSVWPFNWLVWVVPLLVWSIVEDDLPDALLMVVGVYFTVLLTAWGKVVGGYTFYPLARSLQYFTSLRELVDPFLDFTIIQNWAFALFVACTVAMLLWTLKPKHPRRNLIGRLGAWSSIIPCLLLYGALGASSLLGSQNFVVRNQPNSVDQPIVLDSDTVVKQSVTMNIDGMNAFEVGLGPSVPGAGSGELEVTVEASDEPTSRSVRLPAQDLTANTMNRVALGYDYPAGVYTFTLRWIGDSSVGLKHSATDVLPESHLWVNGEEVSQDLAYRTTAVAQWRDIGKSAASRLLGDLPFSLTWLLAILLTASVTLLSGIRTPGKKE